MLCFLTSVVLEYKTQVTRVCGVITAEEVIACQGDGENYTPSFKEPLHSGTEFILIEDRGKWYHIELADSRTCWVLAKDVELVR